MLGGLNIKETGSSVEGWASLGPSLYVTTTPTCKAVCGLGESQGQQCPCPCLLPARLPILMLLLGFLQQKHGPSRHLLCDTRLRMMMQLTGCSWM